jgi:hypothetical protein
MSEFAFYLVPSDPYCVPDEERQAQFLELFKMVSPLPNGNGDYYCSVYAQPQLVHAGQGFEAVVCPSCNARLALFDDGGYTPHNDWWEAAMDGPRDATVTPPCCKVESRLVDLRFNDVGGFAKFMVGALEPGFSEHWIDGGDNLGFLTQETLARFEAIAGSPVLQIWEVL